MENGVITNFYFNDFLIRFYGDQVKIYTNDISKIYAENNGFKIINVEKVKGVV